MKIAVMGSGSWGLAVSSLLCSNGHQVWAWSHRPETTQRLKETHGDARLLPGAVLSEKIVFTNEVDVCKQVEIIVIAVPSYGVVETVEKITPYINKEQVIVILTKGFDKDNNYCLFSETVERLTAGTVPVVALTGPSHAEEVVRGLPTAVVAASCNKSAAEKVQAAFMNGMFRVYTTHDIVGAELGGAMKNVMALAVGISDGAGFGDNTKAMIMTRGIAEMARFGVALGGNRETFSGLSGVGDLIVTCISQHSRNRRAGLLIGKGATAEQAIQEVGAAVEGYFAVQAVHYLSDRFNLDLPISRAMYQLLFCKADLQEIVKNLVSREKRPETENKNV